MPRPREPIKLLLYKGRSHLTKAELNKRRREEIKAPYDRVVPPIYLTKKQRKQFEEIAGGLLGIGVMSNLDCDALARYIQCEDKYHRYDKMVNTAILNMDSLNKSSLNLLSRLEGLRDKSYKQCRASASDLGLTISSRCRLAVAKGNADRILGVKSNAPERDNSSEQIHRNARGK